MQRALTLSPPIRYAQYAIRSNEAARIHHAARQRGGVDARGARPATENASSGLPFVRTARSQLQASWYQAFHADCVSLAGYEAAMSSLNTVSPIAIRGGWQLWRTNWSASAGCDFCPNPPSSPSRERRDNNHPEPRSAALFFSLRHQEVLITARHRGRGVAHPINTNLGIDRIQALFSHFGLD